MVPAQSARRRVFILTSLLSSTLATMATSPVEYSVMSSSPPPPPVVLLAAQPEVRVRARITLRSADALPQWSGSASLLLTPQEQADAGVDGGVAAQGRVEILLAARSAADGGVDADGGAGELEDVPLLAAAYPLAEQSRHQVAQLPENCQGATVCEQDLVLIFRARDLAADTTLFVLWDLPVTAFYGTDTTAGDTLTVQYFQE